jgi:hypothetical protein
MFVLLNTVSKPFVPVLLKAAVIAAVTLVLFVGHVKADEYGGFDESGRYNYHSGPSSSNSRSYRQETDQSYQRNRQEEADLQAERWRQEAFRQEQDRRSNAVPPAVGSSSESYWIQKDGKNTLCVPQYTKGIVSCY